MITKLQSIRIGPPSDGDRCHEGAYPREPRQLRGDLCFAQVSKLLLEEIEMNTKCGSNCLTKQLNLQGAVGGDGVHGRGGPHRRGPAHHHE